MPKISNKQLIDTIGTVIQAGDAQRDNESNGLDKLLKRSAYQVSHEQTTGRISDLRLRLTCVTTDNLSYNTTRANQRKHRKGNAEWAKQFKLRNGST